MDVGPGRVPTSSKMHTFGFKQRAKALKNQRWPVERIETQIRCDHDL